jgi:hypothetical protein
MVKTIIKNKLVYFQQGLYDGKDLADLSRHINKKKLFPKSFGCEWHAIMKYIGEQLSMRDLSLKELTQLLPILFEAGALVPRERARELEALKEQPLIRKITLKEKMSKSFESD